MQKFYSSQKSVKGALDALADKKIKGIRFNYDKSVYAEIFEKVNMKKTYMDSKGKPTGRLNIIDYNTRLSPMTYYLNIGFEPEHHLIYPDGQAAFKFWKNMEIEELDMKNIHVLQTRVASTVKANLLTKPLQEKLINPSFLPTLSAQEEQKLKEEHKEPVNDSILFVGDFMSSTHARVKFLAWTTPNEVLKYVGPLGSIHRRTNAMMANLYSDIRIIACSEKLSNPKAMRLVGGMDTVKLPFNELDGEVCLLELQSNHNKYDIKFHDELHLIIHKLFCTPGALLDEKLHVLGPGAEEYLRSNVPQEVLQKKISMITNQEFVDLSEIYFYWPFKPNTSLETYGNQDSFFDNE
ncbi:hypothetical protein PMKS-002081 [Pichia membranifaciens]|uniref:Uncharacterized protein n=1 Tax=Pichia membranifaciens TaxID=4926 RepID=A0A1Q2YGG7_9ASCO|nr:hypothetical protein PMKS-002081 [Pichia membranifaciens]